MSFRLSRKRSIIFPNNFPNKPQQHVDNGDRQIPFSNTVLIGNWFEERFADKNDQKAITPGIYGRSNCVEDTSVYRSDFKQPIAMSSGGDYTDFIKWKQQGFHNRLNSQQANIYLWNGDQFIKNLTTSKDLMYRIIPEEDTDYNVLLPTKRKLDYDLTKSYGNQTSTGLLKWLQCEKFRDENTPIDVSHYKNNFKPFKFEKRKYPHKGPQKKTSL